ncbi:hypothetical protein RZS08_13340, partial [Arthrospira platensis SPKY1]|nr:hypothetical protein [Arthrospira platensis SPKY1]
ELKILSHADDGKKEKEPVPGFHIAFLGRRRQASEDALNQQNKLSHGAAIAIWDTQRLPQGPTQVCFSKNQFFSPLSSGQNLSSSSI